MKIVALSDWHGRFNLHRVPEADVILVCGDMAAPSMTFDNMIDRFRDLPAPKVFFVPGNHDLQCKDLFWECEKIVDLRGGPVEYRGLTFGGFNWCCCDDMPELASVWMDMVPDLQLCQKLLDDIPKCDVLVSHSPPQYILDTWGGDNRSIGFPGMRQRIKTLGIQHVFCGHVHALGNQIWSDGVFMVYNVAESLIQVTLE